MTVDAYDDACPAARIGKGPAADYRVAFDGNYIIDFEDFAVMAAT